MELIEQNKDVRKWGEIEFPPFQVMRMRRERTTMTPFFFEKVFLNFHSSDWKKIYIRGNAGLRQNSC